MKKMYRLLVLSFLLVFSVLQLPAQEKKSNYGNASDEIIPYGRFQEAYINFFDDPQLFTGAGREKPEPTDLNEVRIGFLGPLSVSPIVPQGIQMLQGCKLSIEEANKNGGYKGLPFKLMVHDDFGLWGASANKVVEMYDQHVWAFLGSIDDVNTHVALRATLKMEIPMMNSGDPDPTLTETRIPWLVHCISDDRQSCYALSEYIYKEKKLSRVALLRVDNRYGRVGTKEFREVSQRMMHPIVLEVRFLDGDTVFTKQINRIKNSNPDAIQLWGNAKETGLIVNQIREMGIDLPIFASDRSVSPEFLEIAGKNAEGLVTTCQYNPKANNSALKEFQKNYYEKFGIEPDVFAAHAYDGMNMIIEAIQKAGLNRYLIRDVMTGIKTYQGITGEIILDGAFNDVGAIWMSKIKNGEYEFFPSQLNISGN